MRKLVLRNKLLCFMGFLGTLYGASPSKFVEAPRFYSTDFDYVKGMKIVHLETKIGVLDDEVYIGRPRVFINDSIVLCDCGKEAVNICFKKGELHAACEACGAKREPVNQVAFGKKEEDGNKKKKSSEINKK